MTDKTEPLAEAVKLAEIGRRIAAARQAAGFTQEELVRATGLHTMTISRVERAKHAIAVDGLMKIARARQAYSGATNHRCDRRFLAASVNVERDAYKRLPWSDRCVILMPPRTMRGAQSVT